jgi:hypothetical protein
MKSRHLVTILGSFALVCAAMAKGRQSTDQMVQFAKSFCVALGWQFEASKAQVKRLAPAPESRWSITDGKVNLILNDSPVYVRICSNTGLMDARRRTSPDIHRSFVSGEANWFSHSKVAIKDVVPGLTFEKTRFTETLLQSGPSPMQRSNANTAYIVLKVISPVDRAGDEINLTMDRINGKVLKYAYWKKRN